MGNLAIPFLGMLETRPFLNGPFRATESDQLPPKSNHIESLKQFAY